MGWERKNRERQSRKLFTKKSFTTGNMRSLQQKSRLKIYFIQVWENIWPENSKEHWNWEITEITEWTVRKRCSGNGNRNFRKEMINFRGEIWKLSEMLETFFVYTLTKVVTQIVKRRRNEMIKCECCPTTRMFQSQCLVYDTRMEYTQGLSGIHVLRLTANEYVKGRLKIRVETTFEVYSTKD